mmetsp:Transcript_26559/g.48899  ORF Transcript_26559/g.48899 Transcript_26559/m.48899 type:complete len:282 (-) Transcript_26559:194-1039(-)
MSRTQLYLHLRKFGFSTGPVSSSALKAAYLQRARELHPDAGNTQSGSEFIKMRQDYVEADKLLLRHPCPSAAHFYWFTLEALITTSSAWQRARRRLAKVDEQNVWRMLWLVGGTSTVFIFTWRMVNGNPISCQMVDPTRMKFAQHEFRAPRELECQKLGGYYSTRVKKAKSGETLQKKPQAKQRGGVYISPIHAAAEDGKVEWLQKVGERSRTSLCLSTDRKQQTALHYSVRAGQLDATALLIRFGADPRSVDSQGCTPLDLAKQSGNPQLIQLFREAFAQ